MNRCEICDCEIKEGWPVSCLHCVGDKDTTGFFDLHKENKQLRQLCESAIDALGCDRSRDDRLHVQELIHKTLKGGE